jgi:capsular polysaccharide transport system permease protein
MNDQSPQKPAVDGTSAKPAPRAAAPAAKPPPAAKPKARPPARVARPKPRHFGLLVSFLLLVLAPVGAASVYLYESALDQYASSVAFTVRREEQPSAVDILGGLSNLSTASSSDSDILYEFIQSHELVTKIDDKLDLRGLYSADHASDPVFALKPDASIEELLGYWRRMVRISYAPGTGLIDVEVLSFDADTSRRIAQNIFAESTLMINELSAIAREDAMRYAREELNDALQQLSKARQALTAFRSRNQIVNPDADIQVQMGLLGSLQQMLGSELIDYDLLRHNARENDPRVVQSERRIEAIRSRIRAERLKFGNDSDDTVTEDYADVVAEFERLIVERQFAESKYTSALSNFDSARANAQRQSRYLAAYVQPTLAESPEYPRRGLILGLCALVLFGSWCIMVLIYYSLRDRR